MYTRIERSFSVTAILLPFLLIGAIGYFGYHMVHGVHGLSSRQQLIWSRARLKSELSALQREAEILQNKVLLLHNDQIDPDLLEELAIKNLALIPDDGVIIDDR